MIHIVWLLIAMLASSPADAIPCWVVKRAVARYGEPAAEAWARTKGLSSKDIERARRCLQS
jgi:hypothetical protein